MRQPLGDADLVERRHPLAAPSGPDRHRREGRPESCEGDLLQDQPDPPAGSAGPSRTEAAERVDVQDHQDHRQGHRHGMRTERQAVEGDRGDEPRRVRSAPSRLGRAEVGQDREHDEQGAGQIPEVRRPGHDGGPERVGRERRGRQCRGDRPTSAPRGVVGHHCPRQQGADEEEQGRGRRRVQGQSGQVVAAGVESEEGVVDLGDPPHDRLVDPQEAGRAGPGELVPAEAPEVLVLDEPFLVVDVDEPALERRGVRDQGDRRDRQGQPPPSIGPGVAFVLGPGEVGPRSGPGLAAVHSHGVHSRGGSVGRPALGPRCQGIDGGRTSLTETPKTVNRARTAGTVGKSTPEAKPGSSDFAVDAPDFLANR